jgi:hypothetical protein
MRIITTYIDTVLRGMMGTNTPNPHCFIAITKATACG